MCGGVGGGGVVHFQKHRPAGLTMRTIGLKIKITQLKTMRAAERRSTIDLETYCSNGTNGINKIKS